MAADVSSFVKQQQREERSCNSEILITKDLLGGLSQQEKVSVSCSSPNSPLTSLSSENEQNYQQQKTNPDADFHDLNLNYPPSPSSSSSSIQPQMNLLFEETCLDLKLQSSHHYQSVCTLDKVRSALQRAEKETPKKRSSRPVPLSSSSAMFAAGCPGCLLYVITLKTNPKCPRCNSTVPSPLLVKKAKIDLNAVV